MFCFAWPQHKTQFIFDKELFWSKLVWSGGCEGPHHRPLSVAMYRQDQDPSTTKTRTRVRIDSYYLVGREKLDTHTYTSLLTVLQCCSAAGRGVLITDGGIMNGTNNNISPHRYANAAGSD